MCSTTCFKCNTGSTALRKMMHRDRAVQFKQRMGWPVSVNADGEEFDEYDTMGATYIVAKLEDGGHAGSLRLISTELPTMLFDHFPELLVGVDFGGLNIWECTRFCISPRLDATGARMVVSSLLTRAAEFGLEKQIDAFVAIFDIRMLRVYRSAGSEPTVLKKLRHGSETICLGRWNICQDGLSRLREKQVSLSMTS